MERGLDDVSKARKRWGAEVFERLFARSVEQRVEAVLSMAASLTSMPLWWPLTHAQAQFDPRLRTGQGDQSLYLHGSLDVHERLENTLIVLQHKR